MYWNILKRDIKRKKTMNVILLLFAVIASMFVSSGLSNVVNIMNGMDHYFDLAGAGNYLIFTQNADSCVEEIIEKSDNVQSFKMDSVCWISLPENVRINKETANASNSMAFLQKIDHNGYKFFHTDNSELKEIHPGEAYVTSCILNENDIAVGDELEITLGNTQKSYHIAGIVKDAVFGSELMSNVRILLSDEDFSEFETEEFRGIIGAAYYVETDNERALASEISDCSGILFTGNRNLLKLTYVMEMLVAMIVLVLSVCLCIVSFVLLKFVISFTITEEYREIGVMKAIGIRNFKIRSIYMTKYFVMALIGGIIGLIAGIPFGKLLIGSVSQKMVLSNDFGILLNLAGAVIVIAVMSGFAYLCTSKVKKSTPVDAIRNGSTGERYSKKTKFSISKSKFGNAFSMALNDVLSAPKRFLTIIISFFLCSVFVFGLVEVTDTIKSDRLVGVFGLRSDVYSNADIGGVSLFTEDGDEKLEKVLRQTEEDLSSLGMPCKTMIEIGYIYKTEFDGQSYSLYYQQNQRSHADEYTYTEGTAPQNAYEVAVTKQISEQTGAKIGDIITIDFVSEKRDCMIVGYFQSLNQMGSVIRLHEDAPTNMMYASSISSLQITFTDHPELDEINERIEKIKEFYETDRIMNAAEYCADCIGVVDTMDMVSKLLLVITCVVVVLVTVLMERSFISDEQSQIALLKAIGFKDSSIIRWQIYRFMIIAGISELLAAALTYPVTKLWCDPIWRMMGAMHVDYFFNPLSLLVVYPGIIMLITLVSAWMTAGFTKSITSNDMGNIE